MKINWDNFLSTLLGIGVACFLGLMFVIAYRSQTYVDDCVTRGGVPIASRTGTLVCIKKEALLQ